MAPSFFEELKAVQESVRSHAEKTISVPGTGGKMAVRFRPPDPTDDAARDRLTNVVAVYRIGGALDPAQEKQLIIDCCDEILVRNGDGQLHQPDGGPLRFDASDDRWGETANTAHDCVRELFTLDSQPLAAAAVADTLVDWLQGLEADIRARVEGNSPPAAQAGSSEQQPG